jgi:hypothetical protein
VSIPVAFMTGFRLTAGHVLFLAAGIGSFVAALVLPSVQPPVLQMLGIDSTYAILCFAVALWGIAEGSGCPVLDALFSDSTPTGGHSTPLESGKPTSRLV